MHIYKKISLGICILIMLTLSACMNTKFEGSSIKNEEEYQLTYTSFHGTDSHKMLLNEGDNLKISIGQDKGSLQLNIGISEEKWIYRGEIDMDCEFFVGIPQNGIYELKITAKQAAGSMFISKEEKG